MAKKEEMKSGVVISEENNTKVTLIRHYMAENGEDSAEFDKAFEDAVNAAIEKMYKKYVPGPVRKLFEDKQITIADKPKNKKNAPDTKEEVSADE